MISKRKYENELPSELQCLALMPNNEVAMHVNFIEILKSTTCDSREMEMH